MYLCSAIEEDIIPPLSESIVLGKYQSGQMGQTVNLLAYAFGGSNPSLPTKIEEVAQLIEHEPSKLRVAGLSPVFRSYEKELIEGSFFRCIY